MKLQGLFLKIIMGWFFLFLFFIVTASSYASLSFIQISPRGKEGKNYSECSHNAANSCNNITSPKGQDIQHILQWYTSFGGLGSKLNSGGLMAFSP